MGAVLYNELSLRKEIEDCFKSFMAKNFNKGPRLAKVITSDDYAIVYCKDYLTPLEKNVAVDDEGKYYIKMIRRKIVNEYKDMIKKEIEEKTNRKISKIYFDCDIEDDSLCCTMFFEKNS